VGEKWAWLFRAGEFEGEIPSQATAEQQAALQLANVASWTQGEFDAYDRVYQEIDQTRQLVIDSESKGRLKGLEEGRELGRKAGLCDAIHTTCNMLKMTVDNTKQRQLDQADTKELRRLLTYLRENRAWPAPTTN
jgi:predicted transposase YdaD